MWTFPPLGAPAVMQLGDGGHQLLGELTEVERELQGASRRPFQLPSQRLARQQLKKLERQRQMVVRRSESDRWASLAEPLAVGPPAAEQAVREALQRLQRLLGPPGASRQLQGHGCAAAGGGSEPGAADEAPAEAEAAVVAEATTASAHKQQEAHPSEPGAVPVGSKRAASGEPGGPGLPPPASKVQRWHVAGAADAATAAHAGGSTIVLPPAGDSPAASPASVTGGAGPGAAAGPGGQAASSTSSGGRSYSRWRHDGRGAFVKTLSASDLLKLRFKGELPRRAPSCSKGPPRRSSA